MIYGVFIYYLYFKEFPFQGKTEFQLIKNIKDNINKIKTIKDNELNQLLEIMLIIKSNKRISLNDYFSFFENKTIKKEKNLIKSLSIYENEPIIGIDLGITHSYVSIIKNGKVEIISDNITRERRIPSMVCFKENGETTVGSSAKNNMLQYPESTIFDSKRLIGLKFNNKHVQEDIKKWPFKVIEDKKTGKPQYVIKIGNEEKKYFPEDIVSIILEYLKKYAENSVKIN